MRGNTVPCNEKMPVFYPKWHKNDYQNEPCYTGVVYMESNFSPRFIDLFSAQNTKVKKVFILITKITRFSLPSVSAVSLNQCPLGSEDAGGLMCSPAAGLESVWCSGPMYICHSMTHGKWIYNQECHYLLCFLSNLPCFMAAVTGPASVLLAGTPHSGSSWSEVTNGIRHAQNEEGEREMKEIQKGTQQNRGFVHEDPYSFCFAVSSLSMVLTTGS